MTPDAVRENVRRLVVDMAPAPHPAPSESTLLTVDLGYDSLSLMELAALLEREFELGEVSEDEAVEAETVGDVEELVVRKLAARAGTATG